MMVAEPVDTDLMVQFECDNIKDDYRVFYRIKRNNLFSSIQKFPGYWEFFCDLDEIWHREINDLEVAANSSRVWPLILYMNAHAKMRIGMELAFSNCMPEARSILRDAIEHVAFAHHMSLNPNSQLIWMKKSETVGKNAYKKIFQEEKKKGLFAGLDELHQKYGELSEMGSHPTLASFVNRVTIDNRDGQHRVHVHSTGAPDRPLFAKELFSRLLTCFVMERTFFDDYKTRLELDARLLQMRHDFEILKENLRSKLIAEYNMKPPSTTPAQF